MTRVGAGQKTRQPLKRRFTGLCSALLPLAALEAGGRSATPHPERDRRRRDLSVISCPEARPESPPLDIPVRGQPCGYPTPLNDEPLARRFRSEPRQSPVDGNLQPSAYSMEEPSQPRVLLAEHVEREAPVQLYCLLR